MSVPIGAGSHFVTPYIPTSLRCDSTSIRRQTRSWLSRNSRRQNAWEIFDCDPLLLHRIPVARCDGVPQRGIFLAECLEIDRHAERRADFVLASITAPNCTAF